MRNPLTAEIEMKRAQIELDRAKSESDRLHVLEDALRKKASDVTGDH